MVSRRVVLGGLLVAPITACTSITPQQALVADHIDKGRVDFAMLHEMALRVSASELSEAAARKARPHAVALVNIPSVGSAFLLEQDDARRTQYVSLPGSRNLKDWLEDFDDTFELDNTDDIPLHSGFENAAIATYAQLKPRLRKDYTIYVAGHSFGGALATIIGSYLVADGYRVGRIVTFGQPRITNAKGVKALSRLPLTRVVNNEDLVSMLPTLPFEQFGEEVILHRDADYVYLSSVDATLISIGELWREGMQLLFGQHDLKLYVSNLEAKLKSARAIDYAKRI